MDKKVLDAAHTAFPPSATAVTLGAIVHDSECVPEPIVSIPIAMMNRHGLIAGATGTGKTRTLQLIAEQLSAAGCTGVRRRHQGRCIRARGARRVERQCHRAREGNRL